MIHGFVLVGGRSARMGRDKASVQYPAGNAMAVEVARAMAAHCDDVFMVCKSRSAHPLLNKTFPMLEEPEGLPFHPLWGVVSALEEIGEEDYAVIAPCDVPYLGAETVARMKRMALKGACSVVAQHGEQVEPLVMVVRKGELGRARAIAERGGSVRDFSAGFQPVELPSGRLKNLNRPEDLSC